MFHDFGDFFTCSLDVGLRHKKAMLTMQIEMMRRDAEHNKHMVSVTGDIAMGTGADTGIEQVCVLQINAFRRLIGLFLTDCL